VHTDAFPAGNLVLVCWHLAEAGLGDVRLAVLGGLGLGHTSTRGLLLGLAGFVLIIVAQVVATLLSGGDRRTTFPIGPALAAGFLMAATA
jgi:leader peptidase (prepilin peptidase)/N-methyltransferase